MKTALVIACFPTPRWVEMDGTGTHPDAVDRGDVTSVEISGIRAGLYYFAVQAYKWPGGRGNYLLEQALRIKDSWPKEARGTR